MQHSGMGAVTAVCRAVARAAIGHARAPRQA